MKNLKPLLMILMVLTFGFSLWADGGKKTCPCGDDEADRGDWHTEGHDHFTDGEKIFQQVKETLLKKYMNEKITDNDLYEAATQGMLQNVGHQKWDKLLSPSERKELQADLSGQVTGIGIELKFNEQTGTASILYVIPGTPAAKAGLEIGDEIVKVDGQFYKGRPFSEMVYAIRGSDEKGTGKTVHLRVLRGDRVFSEDLSRATVGWSTVTGDLLPSKVGLIRIDHFMSKTPEQVRQALENLKDQGAKDMIVDLRENHGGLFDSMVETAGMFIPQGKTIVEAVGRGEQEENIQAKGPSLFKNGRLVVLVDKETSSSAEILAAALKEDLGARVVGQKTLGKWNGQSVEDLPNGFAIKYTVNVFKTPKGEALDGKGLEPDVFVDMDPEIVNKTLHLKSLDERIASDLQLKTGLGLLKE